MTIKYAIALVLSLAGSGMIAGCGSGSGPAEVGGSPPAPGVVLRCHTVVDSTGYQNGPLTTDLAIASLTKVELSAAAASIQSGRPTHAVTRTLDVMAVELMGYSGSKLSDDAQAFAVAEENYNPDGPIDTSYVKPMSGDILALQRDCPAGATLGRRWLDGSS
ncbi:MAG: hypothetical protein ACRDNO_18355 [Trebonia sp.]